MELLNNLINTVGLDKSFFYQLVLAVALYFCSKKILFEPYIKSFDKRQRITKGRVKGAQDLEKQIEEKKKFYEEKAKQVHQSFQEVFSKIKQEAVSQHLKEAFQLQKKQKEQIAYEREQVRQVAEKQEKELETALPSLSRLLVDKIEN